MSSPVVTLYPNGASFARIHAGTPPGVKRGETTGWNSHTAARFKQWLMSVNVNQLMAAGNVLWGFTLTIAETPGSPEEWARLRETFIKRLQRRIPGCLWIWLTEFQRRGTPHLHGVIVAPESARTVVEGLCYNEWPEIASKGAEKPTKAVAQYVTPLYDAAGWLQYMTKHLSRGHQHYQRVKLPAGWMKAGRIYGYCQGWPLREEKLTLSLDGWYQLRRLVHQWEMAEASKKILPDRIRARRALKRRKKSGGRESSPFIGGSAWIPPGVQNQMIDWLIDSGYTVTVSETGEVFNPPL